MKFITLFSFAALAAANYAQADTPESRDVSELKTKIAPFRAQMDAGTSQAHALKLDLHGATHEISYEECKQIEAKIAGNYALSPFWATYKNGETFAPLCDWNAQYHSKQDSLAAGMKFFLEPVQTRNQLGVQAAFLVRVAVTRENQVDWYATRETEYLLDWQYKFLQRSERSNFFRSENYDWNTAAINGAGDYFYHSFQGMNGQGVPFDNATYISADGTLNGTWVKRPRRQDHGKETIITRIYQHNQKDWNAYFLMLNSPFGGFYQYQASEWVSHPQNYDDLFEASLADTGVEVCADGSTDMPTSYIHYRPSDTADAWSCGNIW
jgi:hypothetical protein